MPGKNKCRVRWRRRWGTGHHKYMKTKVIVAPTLSLHVKGGGRCLQCRIEWEFPFIVCKSKCGR